MRKFLYKLMARYGKSFQDEVKLGMTGRAFKTSLSFLALLTVLSRYD